MCINNILCVYVRPMIGRGLMETVTTIRRDYGTKYIKRPEMIIPCGNICASSLPLEDRTTTKLSYIQPGPVQPTVTFKPIFKYRLPNQRFSKETTQKLSYQPFIIDKTGESYPWMQKPLYRYVSNEANKFMNYHAFKVIEYIFNISKRSNSLHGMLLFVTCIMIKI